MLTLSILIFIWGIISLYRTYKQCKRNDKPFSLMGESLIDFLGIIVSLSVLILWVALLSFLYLP